MASSNALCLAAWVCRENHFDEPCGAALKCAKYGNLGALWETALMCLKGRLSASWEMSWMRINICLWIVSRDVFGAWSVTCLE